MNRLLGMKFYGVYALVIGLLNAVGNLVLATLVFKTTHDRPISPFLLLFWSAMGVALFIAGMGVFKSKHWGRKLALFTAAVSLASAVFNLMSVPAGSAVSIIRFVSGYVIFPTVLNGAIIWYFMKPEVKTYFD